VQQDIKMLNAELDLVGKLRAIAAVLHIVAASVTELADMTEQATHAPPQDKSHPHP